VKYAREQSVSPLSIQTARRRIALSLLAGALMLAGCGNKNAAPPAPPPPEVYVLKVATEPISLFEEYVGQA
jgi:multidrug efflux pump subunit AcrA (membrane-fusion protein)